MGEPTSHVSLYTQLRLLSPRVDTIYLQYSRIVLPKILLHAPLAVPRVHAYLTNNTTGTCIDRIPVARNFPVGTPGKLHRSKVQTSIVGKDDNNSFAGAFRLGALTALS